MGFLICRDKVMDVLYTQYDLGAKQFKDAHMSCMFLVSERENLTFTIVARLATQLVL